MFQDLIPYLFQIEVMWRGRQLMFGILRHRLHVLQNFVLKIISFRYFFFANYRILVRLVSFCLNINFPVQKLAFTIINLDYFGELKFHPSLSRNILNTLNRDLRHQPRPSRLLPSDPQPSLPSHIFPENRQTIIKTSAHIHKSIGEAPMCL